MEGILTFRRIVKVASTPLPPSILQEACAPREPSWSDEGRWIQAARLGGAEIFAGLAWGAAKFASIFQYGSDDLAPASSNRAE